jgi:hypothetical protein
MTAIFECFLKFPKQNRLDAQAANPEEEVRYVFFVNISKLTLQAKSIPSAAATFSRKTLLTGSNFSIIFVEHSAEIFN